MRVSLDGAPREAVQIVKSVPGYELERTGDWKYPLDPPAIRDVSKKLVDLLGAPQVNFTAPLVDWMRQQAERYHKLNQIRQKRDTTLEYEYASDLYAYQRVMVEYLVEAKRAINCDKMGLGKTPETIAAVRELEIMQRVENGLYLVIAPNSVVGKWKREIERWYDSNANIRIVGTGKELHNPEPGWYLINWEKTHRRSALQQIEWDVCIGDEAHRMKGRDTKQSKATRKIKAEYVFILTGTPIKNDVTDLWAPLNWLYPEAYSSFWRFFEMYVEYKEDFWSGKVPVGVKNEDRLKLSLAPVMFGRNLDQVEEQLPPVIAETIPVELTGDQGLAYQRMQDEFVAYISGKDEMITAADWRSQVLRLKQIAGSMYLFQEENPQSAKVDALMDLLEDFDEHEKVVIMTQFRSMVHVVAERLRAKKMAFCEMMGGGHQRAWHPAVGYKDAPNREELTGYFQKPDSSVRAFVSTIQTGGEGIDLYAARYFVFLDLLWTPADNEQAWKRIHRRGQDRACFVYSILAKNTVDYSAILPTLKRKQDVIDAVMNPLPDDTPML